MQIKSRTIAKAVNEVLQSPYCDEKMCLKILTSFLAPENHAIKKPEPPIPYNFTPDSGVYPRERPGEAKIDSVYELFTELDENGEISNLIINRKSIYFLNSLDERLCFLRHSIANVIAVALGLPPKSNHIYYHLFAPDKLQNTFVTGYLV